MKGDRKCWRVTSILRPILNSGDTLEFSIFEETGFMTQQRQVGVTSALETLTSVFRALKSLFCVTGALHRAVGVNGASELEAVGCEKKSFRRASSLCVSIENLHDCFSCTKNGCPNRSCRDHCFIHLISLGSFLRRRTSELERLPQHTFYKRRIKNMFKLVSISDLGDLRTRLITLVSCNGASSCSLYFDPHRPGRS